MSDQTSPPPEDDDPTQPAESDPTSALGESSLTPEQPVEDASAAPEPTDAPEPPPAAAQPPPPPPRG